jgi:prolyl-tRNA synthetase
VQAKALRTATADEIAAVGAVAGYASPIGIDRSKAIVVADGLMTQEAGLIAGANEVGYHLLNTLYGRDYEADVCADIAAAYAGASCFCCGNPLKQVRGVEVGNIFQLGTRYTEKLGATYTDERGQPQPIVMGSYGIGLTRVLACIAEEHHDDKGLCWPISVAPFQVMLVSMVKSPESKAIAEQLYADLLAAGVEVLLDDRDVSPGVKFGDADLIGLPIRLTVSDRSLKSGGVEMKLRRSDVSEIVAVADVIGKTKAVMEELADE